MASVESVSIVDPDTPGRLKVNPDGSIDANITASIDPAGLATEHTVMAMRSTAARNLLANPDFSERVAIGGGDRPESWNIDTNGIWISPPNEVEGEVVATVGSDVGERALYQRVYGVVGLIEAHVLFKAQDANNAIVLRVRAFDAAGAVLATLLSSPLLTDTPMEYVAHSVRGVMPSNTAYVEWQVWHNVGSSATWDIRRPALYNLAVPDLTASEASLDALQNGTLENPPAPVVVDDTVGGVEVIAANAARKGIIVQNVGVAIMRVGAAGVTPTTGIRIVPGGHVIYRTPTATNAIHVIREGSVDTVALAQEIT